MKSESRTKTVFLNSSISMITQILQILLGFVVRKVFIDSLGVTYLGYNSVFTNILQMLNLADLGIGVAITSFLFKPLGENDTERVSAIMYLYKKIYRIIGIIVLVLGIVVSFFLGVLIPDASCSMGYLRLLYYITLAGTVSTYFLAYNRTLFIADQKSYVANLVDSALFIITSVLQIVSLFVFENYIIYLCLQIGRNIVANIVISVETKNRYGNFKNRDVKIVNEYKPKIVSFVKDVFISKIGSTIFYSTDNVIISSFRGSLLTGFLSNYTLITNQLTAVINSVLSSLQATYGNYVHSGVSVDEQRRMADNYLCVNYCIGNFCMTCFVLLAQPFVSLFFGRDMLLSDSTVLWLGINLMLGILIQLPSQVFVIYRLFNYEKPIIAVSVGLNIIISVLLVRVIGIDGVLIGTFVTSLIYLFSRFYIISKHVFEVKVSHYLIKLSFYFCVSVVTVALTNLATCKIYVDSYLLFIAKGAAVVLLSVMIPIAILWRTREFKFLSTKVISQIRIH